MSLEALILEEEGHPNPERFQRQGAYLRSRIRKRSGNPFAGVPGVRVFAYQDVVISEQIVQDPAVSRRIRLYEKSTGLSDESKDTGVR